MTNQGKSSISAGELHFQPEERFASFLRVRVRVDNPPEWEPVCKSVWENLQQKWKLKLPGLLISVIGNIDKKNRQPELEGIVQEGLLDAANDTDAWILTDGTDTKLTALVGEAMRDFKCKLKDSPKHDTPLLLGITSAVELAQYDQIRKATKVDVPVEFERNPTDHDPHLERNHTHFLLIKPWKECNTSDFRSEFEEYISTKTNKKDNIHQEKANAYDPALPLSPPKVLFLVGGGKEDKDAVEKAVKEHCPVIVVAKSGGAADELAKDKAEAKLADAKKKADAKLPDDSAKEECCKFDLLHIYDHKDPKKGNLAKYIEHAVLSSTGRKAASKKQISENDRNRDAEIDKKHVLSLAIKWHCSDYAKKKLLDPSEDPKEWKPELFLFDALLEDQSNIINYFLERDVKLEDLLKKKDLEELYNSQKTSREMQDLLRSSAYFFKKQRKPTLSLSYINKVLVHLMRDDALSFDSAFQKQLQSPPKKNFTELEDISRKTLLENTKLHERDLFLWAILVNRRDMSELFWRYGLDHLGGALYASVLLKRLSSIAERKEMGRISEDLAKHSEEWEDRAYELLTKCYSLDEHLTHRLLVRKLTRWGSPKSSVASHTSDANPDSEPGCEPQGHCSIGRPQGEPSVLLIAETHKMMKFVGHPACQKKLSIIWKGYMTCDTPDLLIFLCMFLPIFLPLIHFRLDEQEKKDKKNKKNKKKNAVAGEVSDSEGFGKKKNYLCICLCHIFRFYNAPITKFFANIVANLVYLVIFSYLLLVQLDESSPTVLEYITWAWLFTMFLEEIRQMLFRHQRSVRYRLVNWISLPWNQFDVTLYVIFIITVVLRFVLPIYGATFKWTRWFYSVTLVLCFIRFTQYFYGVKSIGPKVIMIQKMVKDMFLFLAVLLVFVTGFGIAYHANMFPNSSPDLSLIINIFYFPYFQIFGELFLDSLRGEEGVADCTRNETVWRQNPLKRCPEDGGYIVLLMLGAYMIVTNILLVNLLIAMFSHTFQEVQQKSLEVWSYYRLSLVHEYFSRPATVPPFIVIHYMYRSIRAICCGRKEYHAFRRDYKKEERQLTLFERTAVKKMFSQVQKEESATIKELCTFLTHLPSDRSSLEWSQDRNTVHVCIDM